MRKKSYIASNFQGHKNISRAVTSFIKKSFHLSFTNLVPHNVYFIHGTYHKKINCSLFIPLDHLFLKILVRHSYIYIYTDYKHKRRRSIRNQNMSANTSLDSATPLLEASDHDGEEEEEEETNRGFCKKLLDMKEAKNQVLFALPMILTNVFCYSITLVSAMFAGHLGELELAGATLANSWAVVTGIAVMVILSSCLSLFFFY